MGKRTIAKSSAKKKRWVTIKATGPYEGRTIGETYVSNPEDKIGEKLTISHAAMTGEYNRQNLQLKFVINKVHEGTLYASFMGARMLQTTLKKLVRKNKDKLDLSFVVKTKDNEPVRVKVLCTTRNHTTGVVITKLVKRIIYKTHKACEELTFDQFSRNVLSRSFQKEMQIYLKKTYPIAVCEVRSFELLSPDTLVSEVPEVTIEPADEEEGHDGDEPVEEPIEEKPKKKTAKKKAAKPAEENPAEEPEKVEAEPAA